MFQMGTSIGTGTNMQDLAKKLVEDAQSKLGGQKAALAILFASSQLDVTGLVKAVRKQLGNVPLIGNTTAGEFNEKAVLKKSASLALFSDSPDYSFHISTAPGLTKDANGCVQKAAQGIPSVSSDFPHRSAILLTDGLVGRGEESVLAATSILGPDVVFAGGSAGDDLLFKQTFVFFNDQIYSDAVVLAVVDSKKPIAMGVQHGQKPVTRMLTVTKAKENILYEVEGKPAWEVWKDEARSKAKKMGINVDALNTPTEVNQLLGNFCMGISTGKGYKVRFPLSKNPDGSLNFTCTIFEGAKFKLMQGTKTSQIISAAEASKLAKKQMGKHKIAGALVFDCAVRSLMLGEDFFKGVDAIKKVLGAVPLLGFESYGEFCRFPGQLSGLHNTTTVVMLLPA